MSHKDMVATWLALRCHTARDLWFTAGECARGAGVSINTAKKYLAQLIENDNTPLRVSIGKWRNGLNCAYYSFVNWDGE